jgi:FdhD protein
MLSGRISFELVQKALAAGIELIAGIGAPSTLAIDCAERGGVTLAGFVRNDRFNLYAHPERTV